MHLPSTPLPGFTQDGLLPAGDYPLALGELRDSLLVTGEGASSTTWDEAWRRHLVENLGTLAHQLWRIGIQSIYVNGSFAKDKDHPNDIDDYFECDLLELASGRLAQALNALDPYGVWDWAPSSRTLDPVSGKAQLPMWHRYRVELYPHVGQPAGIVDNYGYQLQFPAAFRVRRSTYTPKGIIVLRRS